MEQLVVLRIGNEVVVLFTALHQGKDLLQTGDLGIGDDCGRQTGDETLHHAAELEEIQHFLHGIGTDLGTLVALDGDEFVALQHEQNLLDRVPAYAILFGEVHLPQALGWRQHTSLNLALDIIVHSHGLIGSGHPGSLKDCAPSRRLTFNVGIIDQHLCRL
jgi:hypothetical protein